LCGIFSGYATWLHFVGSNSSVKNLEDWKKGTFHGFWARLRAKVWYLWRNCNNVANSRVLKSGIFLQRFVIVSNMIYVCINIQDMTQELKDRIKNLCQKLYDAKNQAALNAALADFKATIEAVINSKDNEFTNATQVINEAFKN
jgi:hypothetical protein